MKKKKIIDQFTALQFEHGTEWSASQRAFLFLQKSQLLFALVRLRGIMDPSWLESSELSLVGVTIFIACLQIRKKKKKKQGKKGKKI